MNAYNALKIIHEMLPLQRNDGFNGTHAFYLTDDGRPGYLCWWGAIVLTRS